MMKINQEIEAVALKIVKGVLRCVPDDPMTNGMIYHVRLDGAQICNLALGDGEITSEQVDNHGAVIREALLAVPHFVSSLPYASKGWLPVVVDNASFELSYEITKSIRRHDWVIFSCRMPHFPAKRDDVIMKLHFWPSVFQKEKVGLSVFDADPDEGCH